MFNSRTRRPYGVSSHAFGWLRARLAFSISAALRGGVSGPRRCYLPPRSLPLTASSSSRLAQPGRARRSAAACASRWGAGGSGRPPPAKAPAPRRAALRDQRSPRPRPRYGSTTNASATAPAPPAACRRRLSRRERITDRTAITSSSAISEVDGRQLAGHDDAPAARVQHLRQRAVQTARALAQEQPVQGRLGAQQARPLRLADPGTRAREQARVDPRKPRLLTARPRPPRARRAAPEAPQTPAECHHRRFREHPANEPAGTQLCAAPVQSDGGYWAITAPVTPADAANVRPRRVALCRRWYLDMSARHVL